MKCTVMINIYTHTHTHTHTRYEDKKKKNPFTLQVHQNKTKKCIKNNNKK